MDLFHGVLCYLGRPVGISGEEEEVSIHSCTVVELLGETGFTA